MALRFLDGFDKYGPIGTAGGTAATLAALMISGQGITTNSGAWTGTAFVGSGTMAIVAGLSTPGTALQLSASSTGSSAILKKTTATNFARMIGGVRVNVGSLAGTSGIECLDGAGIQASWQINPTTGTISVMSGGIVVGTVLGTSALAMSANTTHYIEWDFTFTTTGAYQIWVDGSSVLSGTGNLRAGTTNNQASALWLEVSSSSAQSTTFDDLYVLDTSGGAPWNAVLNTAPRVETSEPSSDSQTQFSNGASLLGDDYFVVNNAASSGANTIFLRKFTAAANMTLNSVTWLPQQTGVSVKSKSLIYADNGSGTGVTGAPIATGTEVVGVTAGTLLTSAFGSPPALTAGTTYWIGGMTDSLYTMQEVDSTTTGFNAANTYASGPPTSPALTSGKPSWLIFGNCTGAAVNWVSTDRNPPPGDASYAFSSTVGQEDLQNFPALSVSPTAVYAVQVTGYLKKTDAGARTVSLDVKSGGSDGNGDNSGFSPPTAYGYCSSIFATDPATGLQWASGTAVNSATCGYKVAS